MCKPIKLRFSQLQAMHQAGININCIIPCGEPFISHGLVAHPLSDEQGEILLPF